MAMKMLSVVAILFCVSTVLAMDNGLARTPPMGWLSWERFRCITDCASYPNDCIGEKLYMAMGDRLASDGWKELGYVQVNIDDCWLEKARSSNGQLVADKSRFPHGIKALADYLHSKELKLGIYEDFGNHTCAGYPGSQYHLKQDADTFASWGVDMLKLDGCASHIADMATGYPNMSMYLNQTGRPIIYSCSWPDYVRASGMMPNYQEVAKYCNLWRNYDDIDDSWTSVSGIIQYYAANQETLSVVHGPGAWNDPDMLVIGNYGLSDDQEKTQMAMWAIFAAPLLMSNDLRNMRASSKQILQNKAVIAVNQDIMGVMGKKIPSSDPQVERYIKPILPVGSYAIVGRHAGGPYPVLDKFTLRSVGLAGNCYDLTELFTQKYYPKMNSTDTFSSYINPDGVIMLTAKICSAGSTRVVPSVEMMDVMSVEKAWKMSGRRWKNRL